MIYSARLSLRLLSHIRRNLAAGNSKFPFVLMLEPLFKCNLKCAGCGRVKEYKDIFDQTMDLEQCLDAARQAGAPIVSVTGGEPLLHPQAKQIVEGLLKEGYFVYLCSNGLLMEDFLDTIEPDAGLSLVIHLDGLKETHNKMAGNINVFDAAVSAIKKAKKLGFAVRTNTTVYNHSSPQEINSLFDLLKEIGTDGVMVSPAFSYQEVDHDLFLPREKTFKAFQEIYGNLDSVRLYNTPLYWDFLQGRRELECVPWGNPTVNPRGWKSPCYLITDSHYPSYREMIENTDWHKYGRGRDPRCENCMVHSGYEASSILGQKSFADLLKLAKWNFTGRR